MGIDKMARRFESCIRLCSQEAFMAVDERCHSFHYHEEDSLE